MKIGLFSDAHGNSIAIENCFSFFMREKVDKVYFLGDAVGYLPFGNDVIDFLKNNGVVCIKGNHEAMLLGYLPIKDGNIEVYRLHEFTKGIDDNQIGFIQSWEEKIEFELDGNRFFLVHGSPFNYLNEYIYPNSDLSIFNNIHADIIIVGHTHRPFIRQIDKKVFINIGSVGLPRDVGNLSSCCIIDTKSNDYTIYRIPFNTDDLLKLEIHASVAECLRRNTNDYIGQLVNK